MQVQKTSTNFQGVRFPSRVNTKDLNKISEFVSNENNINLIKKLDSRETDIYFTEGLQEIGFAHHRYGYLGSHGAKNVSPLEFAQNPDKLLQNISKAIKKVQQIWSDAYKNPPRGC